MNITSVTINYKTAPLTIREQFAFTKKKQAILIQGIIDGGAADEVVLISTCNRTEFYFSNLDWDLFEQFMQIQIKDKWNALYPYLKIYENDAAIRRLFHICAGLDSMVLGEDQILGQVKDAYYFALEYNTTKAVLNTLFREAITGAKKVKTVTQLSKSSVSVATLTVKKCNEIMTGNYTVLLMGANGKLGHILLKDFLSFKRVRVIAAVRNHKSEMAYDLEGAFRIDYHDRYHYLEQADCVISATASPHCVFSSERMSSSVVNDPHKLLIDLAVPKDIQITGNEKFQYLDIDDFLELARQNNSVKQQEAHKAYKILDEYISDFYHWYEKRNQIKKERIH